MSPIQYIVGDRRGPAAHQIELTAMCDPFVAEALEGLEAVAGDHVAAAVLLQERIAARTACSSKRLWPRLAIAAALLTAIATTALLTHDRPRTTVNYPTVVVTTPPQAPSPAKSCAPRQTLTDAATAKQNNDTTTPTASRQMQVHPAPSAADPSAPATTLPARSTAPTPGNTFETDRPEYSEQVVASGDNSIPLDQVVVVAYGIRSKKTVTGAVDPTGENATKEAEIQTEDEIGTQGLGTFAALTEPAPHPRAERPTSLTESPASSSTVETSPFLCAATMPRFDGGDLAAFRRWVQSEVKSPRIALENGITGRVVVSFAIDRQGRLRDIRVLQTSDQSLAQEVVRILKTSPRWEPGRQGNRKVPVKFTMPIDFRPRN